MYPEESNYRYPIVQEILAKSVATGSRDVLPLLTGE